MSTPPPQDRKALGRARLAARARRISNLRRRVVASALASFALAWGVIAFDGSMGVQANTTTVASTQTAATPAATATAKAKATATATASPTATATPDAAPVTTAQS
jgi:hypothetical protein